MKKYIKKIKNLRVYIISTGSNDKTIPKTIALAFRDDEALIAPRSITRRSNAWD